MRREVSYIKKSTINYRLAVETLALVELIVMTNWDLRIMYSTEVASGLKIDQRWEFIKKTSKHAHDQKSDQEKKKKTCLDGFLVESVFSFFFSYLLVFFVCL